MQRIIQLIPLIRLRLPGWKLRRWLRSFWQSVIELLAIVGLGSLAAAGIYYMMFVR